jgi:TolB-like protein/Tfp pilus assembly protein PilF
MSFFAELKRRNVLRVGAAYVVGSWIVIQVVDTIFPAFGFGDVAVRNATIALAIGLLPTLIFAWAFEWTPEGLKRESEVDRSESITSQTSRSLDRMIMLALALALGLFAIDKFVLGPQRDSVAEAQKLTAVEQARQTGRSEALAESFRDKSIAVLPFVNMSSDVEQEYFSDGISEELLTLLAKIPELRVISRSSAFSYKGKDIKLAQVAEELNVAHILEGSVRKSGDRVRINAQLIDTRSDTQLWSESYDRPLGDIFAIQDEIARMVVAELKVALLGRTVAVRETDAKGYALFLQARQLARLGTAEGFEQSITLLDRVVAIDPGYAPAWSGLSANYFSQALKGMRPLDEGYRLAREAAARALTIDPEHALTHSILGSIALYLKNDPASAAGHYQRALALAPTDTNIIGNAADLLAILRMDRAIALNEYAAFRDPVNPGSHITLGRNYLAAGRWDDAIASTTTALRLSPDFLFAHSAIGTALLMKGDAEAALAAYAQEPAEDARAAGMAMALHTLGRKADHEARLSEATKLLGETFPSELAAVYAWMGKTNDAFHWLQRAVEIREPGLYALGSLPLLASLHADPRWPALLEQAGFSTAKLQSIEFEVTLPEH